MIELVEKNVKSSTILIPEQYRKKSAGDWGIVRFIGGCNKDYIDNVDLASGYKGPKRAFKQDVQDVRPGDVVLYRKSGNQRVEQALHKKLPLINGDYYCLQRHRIRVILRGEIRDTFLKEMG